MNKIVAGMLIVILLGGIVFTYNYFSSDSDDVTGELIRTNAGGGLVSIKIESLKDVGENNGQENAV